MSTKPKRRRGGRPTRRHSREFAPASVYVTPRYVNDDESHFAPKEAPRGPGEIRRGLKATPASSRLAPEKDSIPSHKRPPGRRHPASWPPSSHGQSDDLMNHGAPMCFVVFLPLPFVSSREKKQKPPVVSVLSGGRGACRCLNFCITIGCIIRQGYHSLLFFSRAMGGLFSKRWLFTDPVSVFMLIFYNCMFCPTNTALL